MVRRKRPSNREGSSAAVERRPNRIILVSLLLALSIFSLTLVTSMRPLAAAPVVLQIDHIVIIAMENQNYGDAISRLSAPLINMLDTNRTTVPHHPCHSAH